MNIFSRKSIYYIVFFVFLYVVFYSFYILNDLNQIECLSSMTHLKKYNYVIYDGSFYLFLYFFKFIMYFLIVYYFSKFKYRYFLFILFLVFVVYFEFPYDIFYHKKIGYHFGYSAFCNKNKYTITRNTFSFIFFCINILYISFFFVFCNNKLLKKQ